MSPNSTVVRSCVWPRLPLPNGKWELGKPLNPSKEAKAAVAIQHWALHVPPVRRHKEKHDQHGIWETFPGSLVKGLAKQKQDSFGEPLPK